MQAEIVASPGGGQWTLKFDSGLVATVEEEDIVNVCSTSHEVPPTPVNCKTTGCKSQSGEPVTFALNDAVLGGVFLPPVYQSCYVAPLDDACLSNPEVDMCVRRPNLNHDQTNHECASTQWATGWATGCVCGNAHSNKVDDAMCSSSCAGDASTKCGRPANTSGRVFNSIYATPGVAFVPARVVGINTVNQAFVSGENAPKGSLPLMYRISQLRARPSY